MGNSSVWSLRTLRTIWCWALCFYLWVSFLEIRVKYSLLLQSFLASRLLELQNLLVVKTLPCILLKRDFYLHSSLMSYPRPSVLLGFESLYKLSLLYLSRNGLGHYQRLDQSWQAYRFCCEIDAWKLSHICWGGCIPGRENCQETLVVPSINHIHSFFHHYLLSQD